MKLHKATALLLAVTSLGMSGLMTTPVHAAAWHKGTPKKLRGYWRTANKQNYIWMGKSDMHFVSNGYGDGGHVHAHYRYLGHHTYKIRQTPAMNPSSGSDTVKFRYHNKHIYVGGKKYQRTAKYF